MRIILLLAFCIPLVGTTQPLETSSKVILDDGYDYTELSATPWGGSHGIFFGSKVNYTGADHLWGAGNAVYARDAGQYSYGAFSMGYIANGGQFSFYDGGQSTGAGRQISWNPVMTIMRGGNVGIGTTPAYKLDVWGITRSKSYFVDAGSSAYSGDYQFLSSNTYRGRFIWYSNSYAGLPSNSIAVESPTGAPIAHFFENGNTAFTGNVGIGTTSTPSSKLYIATAGVGSNVGDRVNILGSETNVGGNTSLLNLYTYRNSNGNTWLSTSTRLQQRIDASDMGFIEFNPPGMAWGLALGTNNTPRLYIGNNGNVGIGTASINDAAYGLFVEKGVRARRIKVDQTGWPDYVFHSNYKLPTLTEVEEYIRKNNHLPDVPSANEVEEKGLDLGENQTVLLKKIEELTLYIIEKDRQISDQQKAIQLLNQRLETLERAQLIQKKQEKN